MICYTISGEVTGTVAHHSKRSWGPVYGCAAAASCTLALTCTGAPPYCRVEKGWTHERVGQLLLEVHLKPRLVGSKHARSCSTPNIQFYFGILKNGGPLKKKGNRNTIFKASGPGEMAVSHHIFQESFPGNSLLIYGNFPFKTSRHCLAKSPGPETSKIVLRSLY